MKIRPFGFIIIIEIVKERKIQFKYQKQIVKIIWHTSQISKKRNLHSTYHQ